LATDEARTIDVVLHAIENLSDFDVVVVLQPTSPLRTEDDIDDCIAYCVERHANSCVSVTEASESPYWMFSLDRDGKLSPMLDQGHLPARRQDLPHCYSLNGAIYVAFVPWIRRSKTFVDSETLGWAMPRERSIDIDTEQDIQFLTFLLGKYRND
jgi:CMP-N-acetylneuraminic acid synthetase